MTLRECYEQLGADYDDVLGRLMSETIIKKFAIKFIDDKSFVNLEQAMADNDANEAFRAVHTMKGICLNLGFDNLYKASSELTEKLRGGELDGSDELYENVKKEYVKTIDVIKQM